MLDDVWNLCQQVLFQERSTEILFNQYGDVNADADIANANHIRCENLKRYLGSFSERPEVVMVGEAPGWRGCRFSGVPFTCEAQLLHLAAVHMPFHGAQSSNRREPYTEVTAERFWAVVGPFHPRVFAWNCVPFHPHTIGRPLTNRAPTPQERDDNSHVLQTLLALLDPQLVIAVGRQAEQALQALQIQMAYVAHPARGNFARFRESILGILDG